MADIVITSKTRWMRIGLLVLLPSVLIAGVLTGCKTNPERNLSKEQKDLIAVSKSLPTDAPLDGAVFIPAGLDEQTSTVSELIDLFMANRNWTESLPKKELDVWKKWHPYDNPPVIIHSKQSEAAFELIQLGPKAKAATSAMIQSLTNSEFLTRQWATKQKNADESDIQRADAGNRYWAISVLEAIGSASPEVVPALVGVLHVQKYETGYRASQALDILGLTDTNVLPAVITQLQNDSLSPGVENSLRVLSGFGQDASNAVPVLVNIMAGTNQVSDAVATICEIGPGAVLAVPTLIQHFKELQRNNAEVVQRLYIITSFGKIGAPAREAVPLLRSLSSTHALFAARSLWRVDSNYQQHALRAARAEMQSNQKLFWKSDAIALLGEIGPTAKPYVPMLLEALESPHSPARAFNLAWTIWQIDPNQKTNVIPIFEKLWKQNRSVSAAGALWQIEPERREELRPTILAMLKDWKEIPAVRVGHADMKTLLPALEEILNDPQYGDLHPWAILAKRKLSGYVAEFWEL